MLHGNSALLVDRLEKLDLLDGRFSNLTLVNMPNGTKRGFFSLVFKAYDEIVDRSVAIKFFDLDPSKQHQYRLLCFAREHGILKSLDGASRCLQLASGYETYSLEITTAESATFVTPAHYFATEWLEDDIDDFFLKQEQLDAIEKLKLFNEVVLAVESLHSRSVFHRDLKYDNFRSHFVNSKREVVVIDLGTAARLDSPAISSSYSGPVGFLMYSAPEAFCGMAGIRSIAPCTDMFALGCMLFELFHPDDFPTAYRSVNTDFDLRFSALMSRIDPAAAEQTRVAQWDLEAPRVFAGLTPVTLSRNGSSAPLAVTDLLNGLVSTMTNPNFRYRERSFAKVRHRIWQAVRTLENVAYSRHRAEQAAERRLARIRKAETRAARAAQISGAGLKEMP